MQFFDIKISATVRGIQQTLVIEYYVVFLLPAKFPSGAPVLSAIRRFVRRPVL